MAKKSDYSLFINFFFKSLKKIGLFIIFMPSIFTIHYFFGSLFTIHYKKGPLFTNQYTPSRPLLMMGPKSHNTQNQISLFSTIDSPIQVADDVVHNLNQT